MSARYGYNTPREAWAHPKASFYVTPDEIVFPFLGDKLAMQHTMTHNALKLPKLFEVKYQSYML